MELLNSTLDPISSIISIISLVFIAGIVIPKKLHWKYLAITAIPLFALAFLQMIIFEDSVGWDYFFTSCKGDEAQTAKDKTISI